MSTVHCEGRVPFSFQEGNLSKAEGRKVNLVLHPAWHGRLDMDGASEVLEYRKPFSYILSAGEKLGTYVVSFVREDQMVSQVIFKQEGDKWSYRNGEDHLCNSLPELLAKAMHCDDQENMIPISKDFGHLSIKA